MNYIFLFTSFLILFLCLLSYFIRDIPDFIPISYYPKLSILLDNKKIFVNEIERYSKTNNWTKFDNHHPINNINALLQMDIKQIKDYLSEYSNYINIISPVCRIFWLKLNKKLIDGNAFYCPLSMKYLSQIDNVINMGIMCFEAGYTGQRNSKNNSPIIRSYIPFFIPEGDTGIHIGSQTLQWNDMDKQNDIIIFDDKLKHNFWNYTDTNSYVIVIDLLNI